MSTTILTLVTMAISSAVGSLVMCWLAEFITRRADRAASKADRLYAARSIAARAAYVANWNSWARNMNRMHGTNVSTIK